MANRTGEQERARQDLIDAVAAWRAATCLYAQPPGFEGEQCDGDNHVMECPVERARGDILAAHNKVEQLGAG
jgi:hypothetical protein